MFDIAKYAKALMPLLIAGVLALLARAGVSPDLSLEDALTLLGTSALVYLVPNKK